MTDPDDDDLLDELFGAAPDDDDPPDPPAEPADASAPPLPGTLPQAPPRTAFRSEPPVSRERAAPVWMRPGVRSAAPGCREIGLTTTGFVIFVSVDSVMMYAPFRMSGGTSLLPQAITLLLLAFGLGTLMVWSIRGAWRPVGVGMMLGWVFMTLISAGYFTGLNP